MKQRLSDQPVRPARSFARSPLLFALLITVAVSLPVYYAGKEAVSQFEEDTQWLRKGYPRGRLRWLRRRGEEAYRDFLDPQIGNGEGRQYQLSKEGKAMREYLCAYKEDNPRVKALAILASTEPSANPRGVLLATAPGLDTDWSDRPHLYTNGDAVAYKGCYQDDGKSHPVVFLRAPIAGKGDQLMATANIIVDVDSFEREADTVRTWVSLLAVAILGATFGVSFFLMSHGRRPRRQRGRVLAQRICGHT